MSTNLSIWLAIVVVAAAFTGPAIGDDRPPKDCLRLSNDPSNRCLLTRKLDPTQRPDADQHQELGATFDSRSKVTYGSKERSQSRPTEEPDYVYVEPAMPMRFLGFESPDPALIVAVCAASILIAICVGLCSLLCSFWNVGDDDDDTDAMTRPIEHVEYEWNSDQLPAAEEPIVESSL